jgi:hypothetical protein
MTLGHFDESSTSEGDCRSAEAQTRTMGLPVGAVPPLQEDGGKSDQIESSIDVRDDNDPHRGEFGPPHTAAFEELDLSIVDQTGPGTTQMEEVRER